MGSSASTTNSQTKNPILFKPKPKPDLVSQRDSPENVFEYDLQDSLNVESGEGLVDRQEIESNQSILDSIPNCDLGAPAPSNQSILDSITNCDLGESLDARKSQRLWQSNMVGQNSSHSVQENFKLQLSSASSAKSFESSDSGVYELEDIITENSSPEVVEKVEQDFTPVENIDLTITGKACPRLLSGSQKVRQQEQEIMENLRAEGFIATSKQKASGGVAFEVIENSHESESAKGYIKPKNFLPQKHKERLEKQIDKFHLRDLTTADVTRRQFLAEERRKLGMEAKIEKLSVLSNKNSMEEKTEIMRKKKEEKSNAAIEKRENHLKELRDKLKEKNQKSKQLRLRKLINGAPVPAPDFGGPVTLEDDDDFY